MLLNLIWKSRELELGTFPSEEDLYLPVPGASHRPHEPRPQPGSEQGEHSGGELRQPSSAERREQRKGSHPPQAHVG